MSDEIHGEYPPDVGSQMVTEATQGSLTREKIKEIAEEMESELFMPPSTLQPSVLSGGGEDNPSFNLPFDKQRIRITSDTSTWDLNGLVHGMICMGEAMALAVEAFDHPLGGQVVRARRALEHAIWLLEEARIQ